MGSNNISDVRLIKRLKAFSMDIAREMKGDGKGADSIKEYVGKRFDELADILGNREVDEKQILHIIYTYIDMFLRMKRI